MFIYKMGDTRYGQASEQALTSRSFAVMHAAFPVHVSSKSEYIFESKRYTCGRVLCHGGKCHSTAKHRPNNVDIIYEKCRFCKPKRRVGFSLQYFLERKKRKLQ